MSIIDKLFEHTIIYCERHDLSFWAEPVNALTNSLFIFSAWYSFTLYKRYIRGGPHDQRVKIAITLIASIGVGSFLFHTLATIWAVILDLMPIALFVFAYLRILLLQIFKMPQGRVASMCIAFVLMSFLCSVYPPLHIANGSGGYLAALLLFTSVVIAAYQEGLQKADNMLFACLIFWLSLYLRTMDNVWCSQFPIGTHFMWHTLNAFVMAFMMRFLIFNLAEKK